MASHMLRRVVSSLVTLFVFVSLLFFLAHLLIPGDFVTQFTLGGMTLEAREALRDQLGLNDPVWRQYLSFVGGLVVGNLGTSYSGVSVLSVVSAVLPVTLFIFVVAMGIAFPVGFSLGKTMAWRRDKAGRGGLTIGAVAFQTAFPPLLVFLVMIAFFELFGRESFLRMRRVEFSSSGEFTSTLWFLLLSVIVGAAIAGLVAVWVRRTGRGERLWAVPWLVALIVPPLIWLVAGRWDTAVDVLFWLSLPIVVVLLLSVGEVMLITDGAMAGVAQEDYVLTARAKGLSEQQVRDRHAARVALLPALSKLLVSVPFFLSGLMIIELAFAQPRYIELALFVPGLSSLLFASLEQRAVPTVIGGLLFVGLIVLAMRLLLDFLIVYLDPRIRYAESRA